MRRYILSALVCLSLLAFYVLAWCLPESSKISIEEPSTQRELLLLPLDSRPVCTLLPQQLAKLAGINLILPPKEFLDNYRSPAPRKKISVWLTEELSAHPEALISVDMLLSGGLLQARKQASTEEERRLFSQQLAQLKQTGAQLSLFHVIPRLLVSDELIPDRWYKYRLAEYAQLYDMVEIFGDFAMTEQLAQVSGTIPSEVLAKYRQLFVAQDALNAELLRQTDAQSLMLIGQDDGSPFGLPHRSAELVEYQLNRNEELQKHLHLAYGADELASLLVARSYLRQSSYRPTIYIKYADASIPNLIMPYQPISVAGALEEKLRFLGLQSTEDQLKADILLYVSCGHDTYLPSQQQAQEVKELLHGAQPLALIDLSANFEERELLVPQLIKYDVPLNRLSAYAGWNTFSNSAGTCLAQAAIFTGRLKEVNNREERLQLVSANLKFNLERLLDDYVYQKKLHAQLKKELLMRGIEPTELNGHDRGYAQSLARFFIQNQALALLHSNLGRSPYYRDENGSYYLREMHTSVRLPWPRIFEAEIKVQPEYGCKK